MSDNGSPNVQQKPEDGAQSEHLNIKVTDNNNEVFFKIKRTTALGKLMNAFCDRQGKNISSVRFLFDGQRVTAQDNPDTVRWLPLPRFSGVDETICNIIANSIQLDMQDGDTLEVHQEQIGGGC
jgi:ribosomal protein L21E